MKPFLNVENARPGRSAFDLSYQKMLSADMGLLYPVACDEVVPGDIWKFGNSIVLRAMPLIAPILHEVNVTIHWFHVPYRLLWDDWTDFISGGVDGDDASVLPRMPYPSGAVDFDDANTLWDYFGFPKLPTGTLTATDTLPIDFPRRAYSFIWNFFYRDETLQDEIDFVGAPSDVLLRRAWTKDYFTSALPWVLRGVAPSFPIGGLAPIEMINPYSYLDVTFGFEHLKNGATADKNTGLKVNNTDEVWAFDTTGSTSPDLQWNKSASEQSVGVIDGNELTKVQADLGSATTFDVNDLRTAFQIQKWMERNARSGVRHTEFLRAHFGVAPRDETLQMPVYCGGMKAPIIVSEVLQTSATVTGQTPQGNMAGHGITVSQEFCGTYHVKEFGLMMAIMSIMPKPAYCQGINRQWLRRTKYDFPFPEFTQLGEQAVEEGEIYWQATDALNKDVFGFQARYDEMRYKPNMTVGALRPTNGAGYAQGQLGYWTLTRQFDSAPDLDESFIECVPSNRSWAVQTGAPQFIATVGNHIKAIRPIPAIGTPGYIDHH